MFSPLSNPAMKLAYWDESAYVTELEVTPVEADPQAQQQQQKRQVKADKEHQKPKKRKTNDPTVGSSFKKHAMPSHLQAWSERHAEIHGIQRAAGSDGVSYEAVSESNFEADEHAAANAAAAAAATDEADEAALPKSYADVNRKCCYLCMRQFLAIEDVRRHERASELHRNNLQNEDFIARAETKLAKERDPLTGREYRDRARERRQTFGSSKQRKKRDKKRNADNNNNSNKNEKPAVPALSKGAALLGKMGWSAGSGLGAQGTGTTAPVAANLYAQGVGLGAQGGKKGNALQEAGRNTRGRYDDFLEKTKEQARERYEQMTKEEEKR